MFTDSQLTLWDDSPLLCYICILACTWSPPHERLNVASYIIIIATVVNLVSYNGTIFLLAYPYCIS